MDGNILNVDVWVGYLNIKKIFSLKDPEKVEELKNNAKLFFKIEKGQPVPNFDSSAIHGIKVV